ncbi:MAG: hypothetical protein ACI4I6_07540 [Hominimerdicola sp.]
MNNIIVAVIIICAFLVLFCFRAFALKKLRCNRNGYILLPCSASTKNLEQLVKGYYWEEILESSEFTREIILVQLEKSENYYTAMRLEQEYSIVHCVDVSELAEYLKKRELKCY